MSVHGPPAIWTTADYMLAAVIDLLAGANWQRAGKKNAPRPKPVPRPGVEDTTVTKMGDRSFTPAELDEVLANWGNDGS